MQDVMDDIEAQLARKNPSSWEELRTQVGAQNWPRLMPAVKALERQGKVRRHAWTEEGKSFLEVRLVTESTGDSP